MNSFNDLNINEQVQFINEQLAENKNLSVTRLCKKCGLSKSTVVGRILKEGYKYNADERKYIKDNNRAIQNNISNKECAAANEDNIDDDIKELLKYKDELIKLAKQNQSSIKKVSKDMIIDIGLVEGKTVNHNFKIYESVKKEVQNIQKQYPHYRYQDLVSTALHEYCIKHDKTNKI
ncbi:hypothetical protein [Clostridium botulinum]|uniref:hypothetical protein n=1 Tax=Clostridium botulinum TaxID=1491 RepID=UPI0006A42D9A|nr:hypothetical protein [Clostridium botulinum]KOC48356.1 hypothetical protein ADU88_08490 [Clostridium botulinum]